jgi:adenylate cyclase
MSGGQGSEPTASGVELERKFVVDATPLDFASWPAQDITQGYLALGADGSEVRVRRRAGRATLSVKRGRGLVRDEVEITIEAEDFARLWPLTEGARVEKVRSEYELEPGVVAEVDVYSGTLAGLVVAEVEFSDEAAARRFGPPAWFGREVTDDDAYKNRRLAVDGRP